LDLTSIVIVTFKQLEFTRPCVASICEHTPEPFELVLVDNGSSDGTVEYLKGVGSRQSGVGEERGRTQPLKVTVAANAENRGFPAAANQGIREATGQQILLLNNDTIVTSGWLTRMLRALHSDPAIGIVGPVSNCVSGKQQIGRESRAESPEEGRESRAESQEPEGFGSVASGIV
jgi:GT2 family glycosyltransferase